MKTTITLITLFFLGTVFAQEEIEYTSLETALEQPEEVKILNLSDQGLSDVPASIGKLINLEELILSTNSLTNLPEEISNLKKLKIISLSRNNFKEVPSQIKDLTSLEEIWVGTNQIDQIPAWIENLKGLVELGLYENQINEIPIQIGQLSNLKVLILNSNNIKELPAEFKNLKALEVIHLQNNSFNEFPSEILSNINIEILNIGNDMEAKESASRNEILALPENLNSLTKLKSLDIGGLGFEKFPECITNCISIEKLYMSNVSWENYDMQGEGRVLPASFSKLTNLTHLDLSYWVLDNMNGVIGQLKNLVFLDISMNFLRTVQKTNQLPEELYRLTNLKTLNFDCSGLVLGAKYYVQIANEIENLQDLEYLIVTFPASYTDTEHPQYQDPRKTDLSERAISLSLTKLPKLKYLYLNGYYGLSAGLDFTKLEALESLYLTNSGMSKKEIEAVKKGLANCEVIIEK